MWHRTSPFSGSPTGRLAAAGTLGLLALAACSELPARDRSAPPHDVTITTVDSSHRERDPIPAVPAGEHPEPPADARMVLDDYGFALSPGLLAGRRTLRVENRGPQVHGVELVWLQPGRTAEDVMAWLRTGLGPAAGESYGGVAPLQPGQVNYVTVDLAPGTYVLLCVVPDSGDGRTHVAPGLLGEIRVR